MKKKINICVLLLLATQLLLAKTTDVTHLQLTIAFDWQQKQAIGTAIISAKLPEGGDSLILDAGLLVITSITMDKQPLSYSYDRGDSNDNLRIYLGRTYSGNEEFKVSISYHTTYVNSSDPSAIGGSFGKGLRFIQPTAAFPSKRKQIWSHGEPENNKYWFPCNEEISDIHTTEIIATVDDSLTVISNGKLIGIENISDHQRRFHYKSETPFPNYLITIVVGEYKVTRMQSGRIPIQTYGYPDETTAVEATVKMLPTMMKFLEEETGCPYPFDFYNQVIVQDYPFPGLTGQYTSSLLSDNYIDDEGVHQDFKYLWDGVAVQALAGQWFGNLLMPQSWKDYWLNAAFAQYFAGRYTAKDNSEAEYLTYYLPFEVSNIEGVALSESKHPLVSLNPEETKSYYTDGFTAFYGAQVLRKLEHELGTITWRKVLHQYLSDYSYHQVCTNDFQNSIEKTTGSSIKWFFDQWVYSNSYPELEIKKEYNLINQELVVFIKQTQNNKSESNRDFTGYFRGKIDIEIDGAVHSVNLEPQPLTKVSFRLKKEPGFVHFNFGEYFPGKVIFEKNTNEYLAQLKNSKDVLAWQASIDHLASIATDSLVSGKKNNIIDTMMKEISGVRYWRYRWYVLGTLQSLLSPTYDARTKSFLLALIKKENSWIKATAISMLGKSADSTYIPLYVYALKDQSDRVINAAAIALGKTKNPEVLHVLLDLENQHSWKNQNRISALNGLQQLGDTLAIPYILNCIKDNLSPRWFLATASWDYPYAAVNALTALQKGTLAYPILIERFKQSLDTNDINDIFQLVQLLIGTKDARLEFIFGLLKDKYKNDEKTVEAVVNYEKQFKDNFKP